jgi:hypothetical protein
MFQFSNDDGSYFLRDNGRHSCLLYQPLFIAIDAATTIDLPLCGLPGGYTGGSLFIYIYRLLGIHKTWLAGFKILLAHTIICYFYPV